jgi:hypothetical protein
LFHPGFWIHQQHALPGFWLGLHLEEPAVRIDHLREAVLSQKPPVGRLQPDVYRHLQHYALASATVTSLDFLHNRFPSAP